MSPDISPPVQVHPLTAERWDDFESLFGTRGACGGCWCMWWRLSQTTFNSQRGEGNRLMMHAMVDSGIVPGLLAYVAGKPAGWISLGPRLEFPRLARSRILQPVDEQPVWSIVCFFVGKSYRRQGLGVELLKASQVYAADLGARILEGYPKDSEPGQLPDPFVFTGRTTTFSKAGFVEVARRSPTRPIMRRALP